MNKFKSVNYVNTITYIDKQPTVYYTDTSEAVTQTDVFFQYIELLLCMLLGSCLFKELYNILIKARVWGKYLTKSSTNSMKPLRCVFKMSNDLPNLIVTMTDKRYCSSIVAVFRITELEKNKCYK